MDTAIKIGKGGVALFTMIALGIVEGLVIGKVNSNVGEKLASWVTK